MAAFAHKPGTGPLGTVWLIGLTQIIGYGTLYYSFPILAGSIAAEFGWKTSSVFGMFSLALLAGGLAAPWAGRLVDRVGAAGVMTAGSAASAAALVLLALLPGKFFLIGLIALEIASSLCLYDAAFAALAQRTGREARLRITHMTLIAGFASSLSWPATQALHAVFDWREVLLIFAAINLLICLPLHALLLRKPPALAANDDGETGPIEGEASAAIGPRVLVLVSLGFALSGFVLSGILTMMVPLLTAIGLGTAAVGVAMLFGPAQVLSRFLNMGFGKRLHPISGSILAAGLMGGAALLLSATGSWMIGAIAFAVMFGLGSGLNSIVRGTLPLVLFGAKTYGAVLGKMAFARLILNASAPFVFAWLLDHFDPAFALVSMGLIGALGIACFVITGRLLQRR
jgi:predicted MFS family arabinose efflux permease